MSDHKKTNGIPRLFYETCRFYKERRIELFETNAFEIGRIFAKIQKSEKWMNLSDEFASADLLSLFMLRDFKKISKIPIQPMIGRKIEKYEKNKVSEFDRHIKSLEKTKKVILELIENLKTRKSKLNIEVNKLLKRKKALKSDFDQLKESKKMKPYPKK